MPETVRHGAYRRADGRGGEAMRRRALMLGAVVAPLALPATAQAYPTRPVTLVVPFASGGPTDILARIMADALGERLGTRMVVVNRAGRIVGKYRKIHLPGRAHKETSVGWHNFEKRYFEVGDRAWPVWRTMGVNMGMMICNDRRWPEAYRVMGLQTVELIALGYNSSIANALGGEPPEIRMLHNHISMQAGAYQNATWVCGAAKSGDEEGIPLMGGSCIIAPTGQIVALASRLGPEVITAECDLGLCDFYKRTMFDFAAHRRPEHYRSIIERTGAEPPSLVDETG